MECHASQTTATHKAAVDMIWDTTGWLHIQEEASKAYVQAYYGGASGTTIKGTSVSLKCPSTLSRVLNTLWPYRPTLQLHMQGSLSATATTYNKSLQRMDEKTRWGQTGQQQKSEKIY